MPVFKYVKKVKTESGIDTNDLRYTDWIRDNVKIDLKSGTSVLNLSFKDQNKSLIFESLQKISKTYQEYSNVSKNKSITNGEQFLDQQITLYKKKSNEAINAAQNFAIENNLNAIGYEVENGELKINLDTERIRTKTFNEIEIAKNQIKEISLLKDIKSIKYFGIGLPDERLDFKTILDNISANEEAIAFENQFLELMILHY